MNRPKNRQPRPPRQQQNNKGRPAGRGAPRPEHGGPVPTIQQVIPGAGVSIVLKEDQPTGNETPGVVQDVLTKGNHPRGIKVRLRDGQVGRVQRMSPSTSSTGAPTTTTATTGTRNMSTTAGASSRFSHKYTDVRQDDDYPTEPPPRSLADFFPDEPAPTPAVHASGDTAGAAEPTAKCPFCGNFEGDEVAVSYHVEREHLN